ncbi:hypothetical protein ACFL2Q_14480 [Thermodesulfobacteriota bacterium]
MKRILVIAFLLVFALSSLCFAQADLLNEDFMILGADGKPTGCFCCCVKETCVVARNEADCKKIGGVKIDKCGECEKAAKKK